VPVAADYPFLDLLWTMLIFFLWIAWFVLLFQIWSDIFRRRDIGGGAKTLWFIFTLIVPFLGVFIYLISQHDGMTERNLEQVRAQRAQMDDYIRETAGGGGGAAAEIERAKALMDSGAITSEEYDALKRKMLGP
jgi:hypothetical protein